MQRGILVRTMANAVKRSKSTPPVTALKVPKMYDEPIVDTHCHLLSTFSKYKETFPEAPCDDLDSFVQEHYDSVTSVVDVWCEHPYAGYKDIVANLKDGKLGGTVPYYFVFGIHPHEAKTFTPKVEEEIIEAMSHERCVGLGEIGLDYHYNFSPQDVQQEALIKMLKIAVKLNKPLTIHTREADEDIERILKENVPKEHKIHIHCFTDTPKLAAALLDHFPNLFIGITGVATFSSNPNTRQVIQDIAEKCPEPPTTTLTSNGDASTTVNGNGSSNGSIAPNPFRIVLETDSPFMVPANIEKQKHGMKSAHKLPLSHAAMIPYTARFVAQIAGGNWTPEDVLRLNAQNAKFLYGV